MLGGTAEARALAAALVAVGVDVVSSLAGRVSEPALPAGRVRIGGFGGATGLAGYLTGERVTALVDATHPFARRMSAHAVAAAAATGVPVVRLERPGWRAHPHAAEWTWVDDLDQALQAGDGCRRPFLTTGRQTLARFLPWRDRAALVRVVEPPDFPLPPAWTLRTDRGPYERAAERALMAAHRADLLVTKDSGGSFTAAKLDAAADLGVPVVVLARPPVPDGLRVVADGAGALAWLGAPG